MKKKLGFTLVEIMIVVAIIALLTAIAIPAFLRYREDARRSLCINNMRNVEHAKESYAISQNLSSRTPIHWTNIAGYLNLLVNEDVTPVEWEELTCPEVEDDTEGDPISYVYQVGDDDGYIGDVSGTNRIYCTLGPNEDHADFVPAEHEIEGPQEIGDHTFPRHIYRPGRN